MDGVLNIALILAALGAAPANSGSVPLPVGPSVVFPAVPSAVPLRGSLSVEIPALPAAAPPRSADEAARPLRQDAWLGEDKFRHAGASWAAMVFTHTAARVVLDDVDAAFAVAVPVTAALGIAKEVVDRRRGGPFSARDLVADALGVGAAWLFLREVH